MPYEIREENGKFCLYKESGGDSLGCHESRDAAMAQMRAIYANEATQENLVLADSDLSAGRRVFELDTSDPGFFTNCMSDAEMVEHYGDEERRARVCATLHKKITGISPVEHESVNPAMAQESFTAQRVTLSDIHFGAPADKTGRSWDVIIIGPEKPDDVVTVDGTTYVRSKNGRLWSATALEAAVPMFEGAKSYDDHLTDAEFAQRGGMRPPGRDWLGSFVNVHWDRVANSLRAVFKVVDDAFARKLVRAQEGDVLNTIGLSIDVLRDFVRRRIGESVVELVHKITRVISVDAVGDPAAGGRFVRALESIQHVQHAREANMEEVLNQVEQLIAAVDASMLPDEAKAKLKALLEEIKAGLAAPPEEGMPAEEIPQAQEAKIAAAKYALRTIESVVKAAGVKPAPVSAPAIPGLAEVQRILDEAKRASEAAKHEADRILEAAKIAQAQQTLDAMLAGSGLPEPIRKLIHKQYAGRAFEATDLQVIIEDHRTAQLAIDESGQGQVTGHGGARPRVKVGVNEADQFTLGFVRRVWGPNGLRKFREALGMKWKDGAPVIGNGQDAAQDPSFALAVRAIEGWKAGGFSMSSVPLYTGLDEWYWDLTGGGDRNQADFFGEGRFSARALEANLSTGTLASIVKNAVNVLLAADYAVQEQWWADLVEEMDVDTYDTATLVRLFGVSALSVVNEGAAYPEIDWEDEEETATGVKRGNTVGITLETFLRDKIKKLQTMPERLSKSWYNTIADRVAQVFTTNSAAGPVLSDSGALFNATAATSAGGHANLLTAALAYAALDAAVTAMKKQTDQPLGAGRRLGVENFPIHLLTPIDLTTAGERIINSDKIPGSANNDDNPYYKKIKVTEIPVWTDATDWALLAKPGGVSPIKLIWLRGKRTPELFEARTEEGGLLLTNDTILYKVRQFGFEFSSTYRVAPVADWRSIHKSNVAG